MVVLGMQAMGRAPAAEPPKGGGAAASPVAEGAPKANMPLWRQALPFVVGAGLVAVVLARLDLSLLFEHLRHTNYPALLSFALLTTLLLVAADTLATVSFYRRTIGPMSFRQFFLIRAASYLPSLLNYNLGQAWVVYFVSRAYRAPL